jgi:hypothetical protein
MGKRREGDKSMSHITPHQHTSIVSSIDLSTIFWYKPLSKPNPTLYITSHHTTSHHITSHHITSYHNTSNITTTTHLDSQFNRSIHHLLIQTPLETVGWRRIRLRHEIQEIFWQQQLPVLEFRWGWRVMRCGLWVMYYAQTSVIYYWHLIKKAYR